MSEERASYGDEDELMRRLLDVSRDARLVRIRLGMRLTGRHVQGARVLCGLQEPEFARLLGVNLPTLHRWERGLEEPFGAARTVLLVALRFPEVIQAFLVD